MKRKSGSSSANRGSNWATLCAVGLGGTDEGAMLGGVWKYTALTDRRGSYGGVVVVGAGAVTDTPKEKEGKKRDTQASNQGVRSLGVEGTTRLFGAREASIEGNGLSLPARYYEEGEPCARSMYCLHCTAERGDWRNPGS